MDTVTDLTEYLTKKETLLRSGHLIAATGEEELVAYYMTHMNVGHAHDFTRPDGSSWGDKDSFVIDSGHYSSMLSNPQYIAKKRADEDSYIWDRLVEAFTDNMLAGTTLVPDGDKFDLATHEEGVRHMALVPRHLRRIYGQGIIDVLQRSASTDRITRAFLPAPTDADKETGYFFMTLAVPEVKLSGGYEQYRLVRRRMLETYALTFLRKYPSLKRIVGIATEPPSNSSAEIGSSEDLILAVAPDWTPEIIKNLEESQERFDVAREGRYKEYAFRGSEFPEVESGRTELRDTPKLNRQQRRALKARVRKQKR